MYENWKRNSNNSVLKIEKDKDYYISYNAGLSETALCWGKHWMDKNYAILKGDFREEYETCKTFTNCAEVYKSLVGKHPCWLTIITDKNFIEYLNK